MNKDVLVWLAVLAIMMCTLSTSIFVLNKGIATVSGNSYSGFNQKVTALQADQEVKFDGTAIEYFSSTGTCSWNVRVDTIISGPSGLQGHTVTVALWSGGSGEFPSGSMDPEIEPGNSVGVYGLYVDDDYVTLSGSEEYYITKTSTSNQPSVTVRYPNGGESIAIGTQVQISAHATDDNAVTGVSFYYSCDGGSNWDILGEGARISGTAIGGVWNRTWNTKGLSACTNYMIKAVASDGTFTSEDRSDSTFSLVGTLTPVAEWNRTFGGTGDDFAFAVQQTSDGGYILAGATESYGAGDADFWLVKTDSNGCEQWNKTFGGINSDSANSVHQTSDGGYIIAGTTYTYGAGAGDFWLIKTDSNGNKQWDKIFGGTSWEVAHSVQLTSDGGYILAGETAGDGWLVKSDPNGNMQWEKTFGGADWDIAHSVQQTTDGGYILAGSTKSYDDDGAWDGWLVKSDPNGNQQWEKTFGGIDYGTVKSVRQTTDGGYILAGETASDFWLVIMEWFAGEDRY
jgi:hypothetical protein